MKALRPERAARRPGARGYGLLPAGTMLIHALLFLLGLGALVVGAESLVRGASKIALSLGISPLVVGLTIVALGTSSPEVAVSVGAVLNGSTDIAVGNVVGSNIFNVLFILGISALITPLVVHSQIIRQEVPIMIGASVVLAVMAIDGATRAPRVGVAAGRLLVRYIVFLVRQSRAETAEVRGEFEGRCAEPGGWDRALVRPVAADRGRPRPAGAGLELAGGLRGRVRAARSASATSSSG